jgi:transcriptional regulator GlxA family with amidase domain
MGHVTRRSAPSAIPVALVAFPGVQSLDLIGPLEVFAAASLLGASRPYETSVVGPSSGVLPTSSGVGLVADRSITDPAIPIDTLVVAGGFGTRDAVADKAMVRWVRRAARRSRRVTSVCTGAFLLAAAGLLDGRRATTHWSASDRLARCIRMCRSRPTGSTCVTATCGPRPA